MLIVMNEHVENTIKFIKGLPVIGDLLERRPKVYMLRLSGVIMDGGVGRQTISHCRFAKIIDKVFDKSDMQALALVINSPGGSAAQSSLIASHIRRLADEKEVPVLAFVEDIAASGGYWLACAADEVYAQNTSIVGSVGVISASFGFEDFIEKHGVHRRLHTSGKDKSFLDPFVPEKETDVTRLKAIQKDIHEAFKSWVLERRGEKLDGTEKELFEGQFWTAVPALERGFIDGIGDARMVARDKYGEKIKLIDLTPDRKIPLPLPFIGRAGNAGMAEDILDALESRAFWSRYGL